MKVKIEKSVLKGSVTAPPSKSIAHRFLICAMLSKGESIIHNIALSEDIKATLDSLKSLGAKYKLNGSTVTVEGIKNSIKTFNLDCKESGSTLRFFIPICSILGEASVFKGSERLLKRPLKSYEDIFKEQNIVFENTGEEIFLKGKLKSGSYKIKGNISSQFISGLLFALPLLKGDSTINIIPPIESLSYINLTIDALSKFGVKITWLDERTLFIKGNQKYLSKEVSVEGDYSNAAFFECLNYLGNDIKIQGLNKESLQGDKVYKDFYPMLSKGIPSLHLGGCPDLGPILFALAAAKNGAMFSGTKRLRLKESDRNEAMAQELKKLGVSVEISENSVSIYPINFSAPKENLKGHNDHRIVMALSILLTNLGGVIEGAEAVNKSMPDFFSKLKALGANIEFLND